MKAINIQPGEQGQVIWKGSLDEGSLRKIVKVIDQDLVGSEFMVVGFATFEPGQVAPLHSHVESEEFNLVISGSGYLYREPGERIDVKEGDIQFIPKGALHGHGNPGGAPLTILFAYTPPTNLPNK